MTLANERRWRPHIAETSLRKMRCGGRHASIRSGDTDYALRASPVRSHMTDGDTQARGVKPAGTVPEPGQTVRLIV